MRHLASSMLVVLLGLSAACATTAPASQDIAWPAPPAKERIRFVRTYHGEADLEGSFTRFFRRLAGMEAPRRLYHPVGVGVSPKGDFIAVSDQAMATLFIFDVGANVVRVVPEGNIGGTPVGVAVADDLVWTVVPERRRALAFGRDGSPQRALELPDTDRPTGIAVDPAADRIYVTDTSTTTGEGHSVHVHALSTGKHVATIGKRGAGPGELFFPTFVSVAPSGVFVADTMNARVQQFTADGVFVRQFGERGDQFGHFDKPKGLALDSFGNVYVVDSFYSTVQIFNRDAKLLLFFGSRGDSPGFLSNPSGIAIDANNRIYVANGLNFRIDVYQLVNTTAADSQLQDGPARPN